MSVPGLSQAPTLSPGCRKLQLCPRVVASSNPGLELANASALNGERPGVQTREPGRQTRKGFGVQKRVCYISAMEVARQFKGSPAEFKGRLVNRKFAITAGAVILLAAILGGTI